MDTDCIPIESQAFGDNLSNETHQIIKKKCPHDSSVSDEIRGIIDNIMSTSSSTLDLSRKQLHHINEDLYIASNIKHLHLEGNALSIIPEDFFQQLPDLVWLDLRYNNIAVLPSGIGTHRQLKSLLLEGNPIKSLPVELGDLKSLKALNLRHCPIEFPPEDIVHRGLQSILSFLQNEKASLKADSETEEEMKPVEKLQLSGLMKSSLESSEEWPNEEEMQRFEKLKQMIIQEEMKEFIGQDMELQTMTHEDLKSRRQQETPQNTLDNSIRRTPVSKEKFPKLSKYDMQIQKKRIEERKLSALKAIKEKQALFEQQIKDQEVLHEWRKQSKLMQEKKMKKEKSSTFPHTNRDQVSKSAPYATDHIMDHWQTNNQNVPEQQERIRKILSMKSAKEIEQARASRDLELDHRIKQHLLMMQEKRRLPRESVQAEIEAAKRDLETAERLQSELIQRKIDLGFPAEYRFTAFTGESLPEEALKTQPQNIFWNMKF
ncbi:leucine-rich repeat-containing protein 27 [Microcaecilia unicolor]|uniref:Leucine-rich repeat-containing protein 27 n=1 Tax=Microcaecilia unicolor TaxID=1415580 RepID=A0A6P7XTR6_9AMPH|nr:leucine-rich repeat-containing protein 27 [Microcaecilia unicolor]XP_030058847.1 leucine-rich repeat-containing protein 27 [Microcaecilia unicolor]XP_030058848.1 leucine-rich repeat-containing protein 27 [Microcaecilia unicolor]